MQAMHADMKYEPKMKPEIHGLGTDLVTALNVVEDTERKKEWGKMENTAPPPQIPSRSL
jgi:hypothetical protein